MSKKEVKNYYAGSVESESAQAMLKRINKRTSAKPLKAKDLTGQYPKRVAAMLADKKLVATEKREDVGRVYFAKAA